MVATLIKHEAIRTKTLLAVIFAAATLATLFGALTTAVGLPVISNFGVLLAFGGAIALVPAVQLALGIDYWRTGYRRIGYFTQTLPVSGQAIYWSKLAWAVIAVIAAAVWALVLGAIAFMGTAVQAGNTPFSVFTRAADVVTSAAGVAPWWVWVAAVPLAVVMLVYTVLQYFFAASIGSEKPLNSLGIGGPIIVWFALYIALEIIMVASVLLPVGITADGGTLNFTSINYLQAMLHDNNIESMPIGYLPALVIVGVLLVWRSVVSWKKKVSLA